MKKFALFLTVFSILTVLFSCNNKNDKNLKVTETTDNIPVYTFTKQDTTVVLDLVNQFFSYLENKELRSAVEMLNKLEGDSLAPLTGPAGQRQAIVLSMMSGVGYKIDRLVFNSDIDNEVKVDITLFEKQEGDPRPNTTSFYIRPVRYEGQWYLTTRDSMTDPDMPEASVQQDED